MAEFIGSVQDTEQYREISANFPDEHPYTLERFLIARKMDIEQTTLMLNKHIEWRERTLPITKDRIINEGSRGICFIRGVSRSGYPVIYARTRFQDPLNRDLDEAVLGAVYVLEKTVESMGDKKDTEDGKMILVFDRTNSTRANVDMEMWKQIAQIAQDQYPERLNAVLIYPIGILFRSIWKVFKYFLDADTRNKIVMLGYQEQLLEYIDADELISDLGGNNRSDFDIDEI